MSKQEQGFNFFYFFDHDGNLIPPDYSKLNEINIHSFRSEFKHFKERRRAYFEAIRDAKTITIVVGCDDGRVGVSGKLDENGDLKIYYPKIGGGVPNKKSLEILFMMIDTIRNAKSLDSINELNTDKLAQAVVDMDDASYQAPEYINLWLAQHGSPDEITSSLENEDVEHQTCGLRGVIKSFDKVDKDGGVSNALTEIGALIRDNNFSSLDDLEEAGQDDNKKVDASKILEKIQEIHISKSLPRRLIFIASKDNFDADFQENARQIHTVVQSYGIIDKSKLRSGVIDHNGQRITFLDDKNSVDLNTKPHQESHQDPKIIAISFGPMAELMHDGMILPVTVGVGVVDTAFSCTATLTEGGLKNALAEGFYAGSNHEKYLKGKGHGENFANTQACVIFCDNENYVQKAKNALQSSEFKNEMQDGYKSFDVIHLFNLKTQEIEEYKL